PPHPSLVRARHVADPEPPRRAQRRRAEPGARRVLRRGRAVRTGAAADRRLGPRAPAPGGRGTAELGLGKQHKMEGVLTLETVDGDGLRFAARIGDRTLVLDSSPGATDANPVQALLASIVSCSAMDVIDILRKKRQRVTAYEIHMSGERAKE